MSRQHVRTRRFLRNRNREVGIWLDEYDHQILRLQQPGHSIYESQFARADREWRDEFGYVSSPVAPKAQPYRALGGRPLRCYQTNGYLIIETERGYTIRPVRRSYSEAEFFEHPFSSLSDSHHSTAQVLKLLSTATHHLQESWQEVERVRDWSARVTLSPKVSNFQLVDSSQQSAIGHEVAMQALIAYWNAVENAIRQLESLRDWEAIYRFCQHKSRFCLGHRVCVTSNDSSKAHGECKSETSDHREADLERITALIPTLSEDMSFIMATVTEMLEKFKSVEQTSPTTALNNPLHDSTPPHPHRKSSQTPPTDFVPTLEEQGHSSSSAYHALFDALASTALPAPAPPPPSTKKRPIISRPVLQHARTSSVTGPRFSLDSRPLRSISGRLTGSRWRAWIPDFASWQGGERGLSRYRSIFKEGIEGVSSEIDIRIAEGKGGVRPGMEVGGRIAGVTRVVVPPRGRLSVVSLSGTGKMVVVLSESKKFEKAGRFNKLKQLFG